MIIVLATVIMGVIFISLLFGGEAGGRAGRHQKAAD